MVAKTDLNRDYYADLELPPTADVADIKKQYRKLALKWHPDRNVGREEEVRPRFVVIQDAMEILSDPVQKQMYDANRKRTSARFPGASGVRGNPWSDVSSKFPTPPRRNAPPSRPPQQSTSGASRYAEANWTPPPTRANRDNTKDNAKAWERMRPSSGSGRPAPGPSASSQYQKSQTHWSQQEPSTSTAQSSSNQQQTPRRPTKDPEPASAPRTAGQKQRAEAAFGRTTRRTGFAPASPMGDEPSVSNNNYFTTKTHTNIFEVASAAAAAKKAQSQSFPSKPPPSTGSVDPLSQQFGDTFLDERQSTPYSNNIGEKTNPFDGANISRARTVRDAFRRVREANGASASASQRQRSASVGESTPKAAANPTAKDNAPFSQADSNTGSAANGQHESSGFSAAMGSTSSNESTKANRGGAAHARPPLYDTSPSSSYKSEVSEHDTFCAERCDPGIGGTPPRTLHPKEIFRLFSHPPSQSSPLSSYTSGLSNGDDHPPLVQDAPQPTVAAHGKQPLPSQTPHMQEKGAVHGDSNLSPVQDAPQANVADPGKMHIPSNIPCVNVATSNLKAREPYWPLTPGSFDHTMWKTVNQVLDGMGKKMSQQATDDTNIHMNAKQGGISVSNNNANASNTSSFTFNIQDDTFKEGSSSKPPLSTHKSTSDINTRFTDKEDGSDYHFHAGGPSEDDPFVPSKHRNRTDATRGSQPTAGNETTSTTSASGGPSTKPGQTNGATAETGFDADQWTAKIGPHNFVPPQLARASSSPTRRTGRNLKATKANNGAAARADEEDKLSAAAAANTYDDTTTPMDIDMPSPSLPPRPSKDARPIQVEPFREEWRAGSGDKASAPNVHATMPTSAVSGATSKPAMAFKNNAGGSEDHADFLRSDMFAHTELYGNRPTGLNSFGDLAAGLPFEPKASAEIPIEKAKKVAIKVPEAPYPPVPPPALAITGLQVNPAKWNEYVEEFMRYEAKWADYSRWMAIFFADRQKKLDEARKADGFNWVRMQGDTAIDEYLEWIEEDNKIRQKWMNDSANHIRHVTALRTHRLHMKQGGRPAA